LTGEDRDQSAALQRGLDETTLRELLALAGPTDGPELMCRLIADINGVVAGMTAGLAALDHAAMRWHSHVLLAIAGTIGAAQVSVLAKRLNEHAKADDAVSTRQCATRLMADLDGLLGQLQQMSGEPGRTR
jgi:HPt (histidine-containing phosphotransfer) domain-containing protein